MRRRVRLRVVAPSTVVLGPLLVDLLPVHLHLGRAADADLLGAQSSRVELVGHLVVGIPRDAREAGLLMSVLAGRLGVQATICDVAARLSGITGRGVLVEHLVARARSGRRVDTRRGAPRRPAFGMVVEVRGAVPRTARRRFRTGARLGADRFVGLRLILFGGTHVPNALQEPLVLARTIGLVAVLLLGHRDAVLHNFPASRTLAFAPEHFPRALEHRRGGAREVDQNAALIILVQFSPILFELAVGR
mmetsp:Transcript_6697/g.17117  ORF Transcript_6697/g.17117 Transcript_6697/m.17117 type:complete len:248 (-) Transcript_6697:6612-7355(-)